MFYVGLRGISTCIDALYLYNRALYVETFHQTHTTSSSPLLFLSLSLTIISVGMASSDLKGATPKKQILINAFDMFTVGHLSPGQWKVITFTPPIRGGIRAMTY